MIRISERPNFEREFARKAELLNFDRVKPNEKISSGATYITPAKPVAEYVEVGRPQIPEYARRLIPVSEVPRYPPPPPPLIPGNAHRLPKRIIRDTTTPTTTPAKNFLDKFFDWLNKILSGK